MVSYLLDVFVRRVSEAGLDERAGIRGFDACLVKGEDYPLSGE